MENRNQGTTVLVTGSSGFIATHCILQLLQQGYTVRGTLRAMGRRAEVVAMLTEGGATAFDRLSFVEADLNVSIERFAYLTGRSLSAFKRDFERAFGATPGHWLVKKRLEEARHLISKKGMRPSDIYLDLGFENLSHFSFAFRKLSGSGTRIKP